MAVKRMLSVLAAAAACLASAARMPPPAVAASPGLVADLSWFPAEAERERTAAELRRLGSEWVRLDLGWRDFEPEPGVYSPWAIASYEREFRRARAAGQRVIVMVHTSPMWASAQSDRHAPPRDPADFARFLRFVVRQYAPLVDAWEVWNEPNYARFWPTGPDPVRYAALLRAAYPAIKAEDPNATVLFGGLSTNDYEFLAAAYAAGARGSFDALATHPYTCARPPQRVERGPDGRMTRHSFLAYRELRAVMRRNDDLRPIWFTEFGWSTATGPCGVSERTQAAYLGRALRLIERDRYVRVAAWYALRNNYWEGDADRLGARYGLLRTDFSPKPAFTAFARYARGPRERGRRTPRRGGP